MRTEAEAALREAAKRLRDACDLFMDADDMPRADDAGHLQIAVVQALDRARGVHYGSD